MDHLDRQHKHTDARCTLFHVSFNVAVLQKVGLSTIGVVTIDRMALHCTPGSRNASTGCNALRLMVNKPMESC